MGSVYVKVHTGQGKTVIAACDESILGEEIDDKARNRKIRVSQGFYGGKLVPIEDCLKILQECDNFNIIGKEIVEKAKACKLVHESAIIKLDDVPHAIRFRF